MKSKIFTENSLARAQEAVAQWLAANKGRVKIVKEHPPVMSRQAIGFQKKADAKVTAVSITIEYEEISGP
jgi:hypothetical protein